MIQWNAPKSHDYSASKCFHHQEQLKAHLLAGLDDDQVFNIDQLIQLLQNVDQSYLDVSPIEISRRNRSRKESPGDSRWGREVGNELLEIHLDDVDDVKLVSLDQEATESWSRQPANEQHSRRQRFESKACLSSPKQSQTRTRTKFECSCPQMTIDQYCQARIERRREWISLRHQHDHTGRDFLVDGITRTKLLAEPSEWEQRKVFGVQLTRNKQVKELNLAHKLTKSAGNELLSLCLYKLEGLVSATNDQLAVTLARLASNSNEQLSAMIQRSTIGNSTNEVYHQKLQLLDASGACLVARRRKRKLSRRIGQGIAAIQCDSSIDSGVNLDADQPLDPRPSRCSSQYSSFSKQLNRHLELRSSSAIQAIVRYSCQLFIELISNSSILGLNHCLVGRGNGIARQASSHLKRATHIELLDIHQFKLLACAECQQLRAKLRYDWLEKCLWLAFNFESTAQDNEEASGRVANEFKLPPIDLIDGGVQNEVANRRQNLESSSSYFTHLALILSQLLRNQFLAEALSRLQESVESRLKYKYEMHRSQQQQQQQQSTEPLLSVSIELIEGQHQSNSGKLSELICTQPGDELKGALGFLVDELARICSDLPRLESLLQFQACDQNHDEVTDPVTKCIGACYGSSDELLEFAKNRLVVSIDDFNYFERPIETQLRPSWIGPDYGQIIDQVNGLRLAQEVDDLLPLDAYYATSPDGIIARDSSANGDDWRLLQLNRKGQQVRLLNQLEQRLACQAQRYFDIGQLVRLDCEPLRQVLLRHIRHERLLLVRVKIDELLKLFERLCLQFDEIELAIDLESAIEDHLNKRWQAKQSQQPRLEHRVLLANSDANDVSEDEHGDEINEININIENDPITSEVPTGGHLARPGGLMDRSENRLISERIQAPMADSNYDDDDEEDDDECRFAETLMGQTACVAQVFAIMGSAKVGDAANNGETGLLPADELAASNELKVAPIIECRLLVGRFKYATKLLNHELEPLVADLRLALGGGLLFVSEFTSIDPNGTLALEPVQLELISELSCRCQEFQDMLKAAIERLYAARKRLVGQLQVRFKVLSRLTLEFDSLMSQLNQRRLGTLISDTDIMGSKLSHNDERPEARQLNEPNRDGSVEQQRQLDAIQETANWAQRLDLRLDFLTKQNQLLIKELHLLAQARLNDSHQEEHNHDESMILEQLKPRAAEEETHLRACVLDKWRLQASRQANFWHLVEDFETRQVKWLNSDARRVEFGQIKQTFEWFQQQASSMLAECRNEPRDEANESMLEPLKRNLLALEYRLNKFATGRLPIFKFLANRHLEAEHWIQLGHLLGGIRVAPQNYTTVAQLLELEGLGEIVGQLEELGRKATIQHQLGELMLHESVRMQTVANTCCSHKRLAASLSVSQQLSGWTDDELTLAASRFIRTKLLDIVESLSLVASDDWIMALAGQAVGCYSLIRRYLRLDNSINLIVSSSISKKEAGHLGSLLVGGRVVVVLGDLVGGQSSLSSSRQLEPTYLIESLRLFSDLLHEQQEQLSSQMASIRGQVASIDCHLEDIDQLLGQVRRLNEVELTSETALEGQLLLEGLERSRRQLELEREIVATKEAWALEGQREALKKRDGCVRQICERAIPALRAASRALDCLGDGASIRALRNLRPRPPLAVRLVIETICLLRNSCLEVPAGEVREAQVAVVNPGLAGGRELAVSPAANRQTKVVSRGRLHNYWPLAWKTLNGCHSCKFLADLRQINSTTRRRLQPETMRLIRLHYLARPEFNLAKIERISREAALLARWLIAVDIFDRVINTVRPKYLEYQATERQLDELLGQAGNQRHRIERIEAQLEAIGESIRANIEQRARFQELVSQCAKDANQMSSTRQQLAVRRDLLVRRLAKLELTSQQLLETCFWSSIQRVYLDSFTGERLCQICRLINQGYRTMTRGRMSAGWP